jgi:hypothetical protein
VGRAAWKAADRPAGSRRSDPGVWRRARDEEWRFEARHDICSARAVSSLGVVFGVIGMLIAEPLLAAVLVATKMLYVNDVVGDDVVVGKKQ